MPEEKKAPASSHLGVGMLVGSIIGVAAGLFMQSKKGKEMRKDLVAETTKLQAKLMKELKNSEELTKETYEKLVDKVMDHFVLTKEIAKKDVPEVRAFFMKKWTTISAQFKALNK
jgi:gas vesicle protein